MIDFVEVWVGQQFAVYIVNADSSGLADDEEFEYDEFEALLQDEYGSRYAEVTDEVSEFGQCAVTGLSGPVVLVKYHAIQVEV